MMSFINSNNKNLDKSLLSKEDIPSANAAVGK